MNPFPPKASFDINASNAKISPQDRDLGDSLATLETVPMDFSSSNMDCRVTFSSKLHTVVATIPSIDDLSTTERKSVWWSQRHFQEFRKNAKIAAHNAKAEQSLNGQLYLKAKHYADFVKEDNLEEFLRRVPGELSSTEGPRGLEHWASKEYFDTRRKCMKDAKKLVLLHSQDNNLAQKYQHATRASRVMARWKGEADALVLVDQDTADQGNKAEALSFVPLIPPALPSKRVQHRRRKVPVQHRSIA